MPWAKIDDGWWCHPKVMQLDLEACGLWARALSWSCAQRTPYVPAQFPAMVGASEATAKQIEASGLWHGPGHDCPDCEDPETGWIVHDWREYQERTLSEKRAEAGRKGGKASGRSRANSSNTEATGQANAKQTPKQVPVPSRPVPEEQQQGASADADADEIKQRFEDHFWPAYPKTNGVKRDKQGALRQWRKLTLDEQRRAVIGAQHKAAHFAATGEQPPYAARFLRRRDFDDYQRPPKPGGGGPSGARPDMPDGPLEAEADYKARMASLTGLEVA